MESTAKWARESISIGTKHHPTMLVQPWALGPRDVPLITDAAEAEADVLYAMFSVLLHRLDADPQRELAAFAEALATIDTEKARELAYFTDVGLGETMAQEIWRTLMQDQKFNFSGLAALVEADAEARGEARGEAKAVLRILERREVEVPEQVRERILACEDLDVLGQWLDRAFEVTTADGLFTTG